MTDRTDPKFWQSRWVEYQQHVSEQMHAYARFCDWFAGNTSALLRRLKDEWKMAGVVDSNMIHLVVRSWRAAMFYRNPRVIVRKPAGFGGSVFSDELAELETLLLNDWTDEVDMFTTMRRTLLDGALGGRMVNKIGFHAVTGADLEALAAERLHAQRENIQIATGGKPRVMPADLHAIHIEEIDQLIAHIERGDAKDVPRSQVDYAMRHRQKHVDALKKHGEAATEHVRFARVFLKKVALPDYGYDHWADTQADREWVGEAFMRPMSWFHDNPDYDKKARMAVNEAKGDEILARRTERPRSGKITRVLAYEIIDLRAQTVITYAEGASTPLLVKPYPYAKIMPSGPYIDSVFSENPLTGVPIAPPYVYEDRQVNLAVLDTLIMTAGVRSTPQVAVLADKIKPEELDAFTDGIPMKVVTISSDGIDPDIRKFMAPVPIPELSSQVFVARAIAQAGIEQYSGQGSAKLAGGDQSKTATASAVIAESTTNLAEDDSAVVDRHLAKIYKMAMRLMRQHYSDAQVAELAGQDAALGEIDQQTGEPAPPVWPAHWAARDIVNDRGVDVVTGSSKRKSIAVEQKLLQETVIALLDSEIIPPPAKVELLERLFDSMGIFGVDLSGVEGQAQLQQALAAAQAQAEAEGEPGNSDPKDRPKRRVRERNKENSRASTNGGTKSPASGVAQTRKRSLEGARGGG